MINKRIFSILFALLIVIFTSCTYANTSDTGTITFKAIDSNNNEVDNLEVLIYKVADFEKLNFIATEEFSKFDIDDLSSNNITNMQEYASENVDSILTKTTNSNGEFTIDSLELGKYLIVQNNRKDDCIMQTMLISIPEITEEGINFVITAKPKIAIKENTNEDIVTPNDSILPQTGILDWPIPVLAISGIIMFCVAWILFYSKKKVN